MQDSSKVELFKKFLSTGGTYEDFYDIYKPLITYTDKILPSFDSIIWYIRNLTNFNIQSDDHYYYRFSGNSGICFVVYDSKLSFYLYKEDSIYKIKQVFCDRVYIKHIQEGTKYLYISDRIKEYLFCTGHVFVEKKDLFVFFTE